jgi:hypothetical protein
MLCYEATNATVVDDAIRFVALHAVVPTITEKANSDERITVDEENISRNDIQGSVENRSDKQHSTTAGPAMINYTLWDLPLSELS